MNARYKFDESVTTEQAEEVKRSIFRFPNGSASYAARLTTFERVDPIFGRKIGSAKVSGKTYEVFVEMTPGASRIAFGMGEFSIGLKEV